jgi:hypothetical protein
MRDRRSEELKKPLKKFKESNSKKRKASFGARKADKPQEWGKIIQTN